MITFWLIVWCLIGLVIMAYFYYGIEEKGLTVKGALKSLGFCWAGIPVLLLYLFLVNLEMIEQRNVLNWVIIRKKQQ